MDTLLGRCTRRANRDEHKVFLIRSYTGIDATLTNCSFGIGQLPTPSTLTTLDQINARATSDERGAASSNNAKESRSPSFIDDGPDNIEERVAVDQNSMDTPNPPPPPKPPSPSGPWTEVRVVIPAKPLTSVASTFTESFEEKTGRKAGTIVVTEGARDINTSYRDWYYPFSSELEFGIAHWFMEEKVSKGAIDRFFRSPFLQPITQSIGFRQANDVFRALYPVTSDTLQWATYPMTIPTEMKDVPDIKVTLRYRRIDLAIKALLGSIPLKEHLTYSPYRQYGSDGERIYTDMASAEWWWEMQERLPEGATLVPVLLSSDKTQLTNHSGDQASWPVYLTLGNFSHEARRSRKLDALVMVALMPILSQKTSRAPRSHVTVYHNSMKEILQRQFVSMSRST